MRSAVNLNIYYAVITLLTMINAVVTWKRRSRQPVAHVFLATMLWVYWYSIVVGLVTMSSLIDRVPHFFRTVHAASLLFMPASYLYVRRSLDPDSRLRRSNLLHFTPLLLFLVDYMPFFLLSGQKKLAIIHAMDPRSMQVYLNEGWFMPAYYHVSIRYLTMFAYLIAQVNMMKKAFRTDVSRTSIPGSLRKWLTWMSACQLLIILPSLVSILFSPHDFSRAFFLQSASLLGAIMMGGYLVMNPEIFYGLDLIGSGSARTIRTDRDDDRETNAVGPDIPKSYTLSEAFAMELDGRVQTLITQKPFWRNPDYRLADLARDAGVTTHQISAYLNQVRNQNFYDFINSLRVDEFVCQLGKEGWRNQTLEALAKSSGFSNRITFIRAFKRSKGVTPSDFIKNKVVS